MPEGDISAGRFGAGISLAGDAANDGDFTRLVVVGAPGGHEWGEIVANLPGGAVWGGGCVGEGDTTISYRFGQMRLGPGSPNLV